MDETTKYRELFFEETDEYLQTLNECILELEKNPGDSGLLDEIFRAAHTLKGMAATMGYKTMTELTHRMENVFELFRSGSVEVNSDIISLIFRCLDQLSEIVEDLREENYIEYDIGELLKELDNVSSKDTEITTENYNSAFSVSEDNISSTDAMVINNAHGKNYNAFNIAVKVSEGCLLKGARAYLIVNKLEQNGDIIHTEPSTEKLEEGEYGDVFKLIYLTRSDIEEVKSTIINNAEIEDVIVEEIGDLDTEASSKADEAPITKKDKSSEKSKEKNKEKSKTKAKSKSTNRNHSNNLNQSIRVDLDRLDSFMNLVSELVIYRTRLEDISNQHNITEINEPLEHVGRITSDLQDLVLKIRMQPVNVVLNRFPRMIRDLSKELNKEIELVIEGEETELDRTVVSELGEPLVHLMRNAADHGIESADRRVALGKPKKGLIKLTAHQEGNRVVITVKDDGKGIDPEVIKESAIRKGIDVEGLGDKELIQLIFHQGFSTAKNVTNVSGRGVGMDVVRQKISSLGGDIQVLSEVNIGTTFLIKLPLTLSIIQTLMVNVGEETFAVPLGIIERVVKVEPHEIIKSHNSEIYIERGKAIPIIRVNERLEIESTNEDKHIILITLGEQHYGLLVDDLIGQQEIVIKKLGQTLKNMKEYLGATILGNGDIILILDVGNLCGNGKGVRHGNK